MSGWIKVFVFKEDEQAEKKRNFYQEWRIYGFLSNRRHSRRRLIYLIILKCKPLNSDHVNEREITTWEKIAAVPMTEKGYLLIII